MTMTKNGLTVTQSKEFLGTQILDFINRKNPPQVIAISDLYIH